MTSLVDKLKIPTLLGLGIIFLGTVAGVFLVVKDQTNFKTSALPDIIPENVIFTNIEDQSITVSWQTSQPVTSLITFGQANFDEQTVLDDRDTKASKPHLNHYITIKNLQPKTAYLLKIISGKHHSETLKFSTASSLISQTDLNPIIGTVLEGQNTLDDGIVYLAIAGATTQSALVKNLGNFLIPLSKVTKSDLSGVYRPTGEEIGKLTIISDKGEASSTFKLRAAKMLPPLKLGQNLDLTNLEPNTKEAHTPTKAELNKFDLNNDDQINANDHALVLLSFGKSPRNKRADINSDGVVDQNDVALIAQKMGELGLTIPPNRP